MSINFDNLKGSEHLTKRYSSSPYVLWKRLKRCYEMPFSPEYQNYGAKGFTMCEQWSESFVTFWNDIHDSYVQGMTITVKDRSLPLSKRNVQWIEPHKLQASHICKPIAQICSDGLVIATYPSIRAASRATGIHEASIAKVVRGTLNITGGKYFAKFYT